MSEASPTVFVVDDDAAMRKSIGFLVESIGLEAEAYASAQEFMDGASPDKPGCLLLDVRMPGLSGLDLLDRLGSLGFRLPVIMITGHADVPMAVRALQSGAGEFIEKPFNDQLLLDKIQSAVAQDAESRRVRADRQEVLRRVSTLTPRESEVMELVVAGNANKQTAADLGLSEKTIEVHRSRVMKKMGAVNAADLIRMVLEARQAGADGA